eukprot:2122929-Alexandrium_andersonii.AAC.1
MAAPPPSTQRARRGRWAQPLCTCWDGIATRLQAAREVDDGHVGGRHAEGHASWVENIRALSEPLGPKLHGLAGRSIHSAEAGV